MYGRFFCRCVDERVVNLVYDLLVAYDIGLLEDIPYVDLADAWVKLVHKYWNDDIKLKEKLKKFLEEEGVVRGFNIDDVDAAYDDPNLIVYEELNRDEHFVWLKVLELY